MQRDDFKDPRPHTSRTIEDVCAHICGSVCASYLDKYTHRSPRESRLSRSRHVEDGGSKGQCFSLSSLARLNRVSSSLAAARNCDNSLHMCSLLPLRGIETAIKSLVVAKAYIAVICRPSFLATAVAAAASVRCKGLDKSLRLCGARTERRRYIKAAR